VGAKARPPRILRLKTASIGDRVPKASETPPVETSAMTISVSCPDDLQCPLWVKSRDLVARQSGTMDPLNGSTCELAGAVTHD
jgi:hypothetical protein